MPSLQLNLDFSCCVCGRPVGVTLDCAGDGLRALHPTAAVSLACPNCGRALWVEFRPYERKVTTVRRQPLPQPCPN